jgi:hypothetical protein
MYKPESSEYDPYYEHYVSLVPERDPRPVLSDQSAELSALLSGVAEENGTYSYADGKWTIKEILSHLIDAERMFAYRLFRIARGDKTPIEGFEQEGYIENAHANGRSFAELLKEFDLLRQANMLLINNFRDEAWTREGTANNMKISVRALVTIMAGHVRHHIDVLGERYLEAIK